MVGFGTWHAWLEHDGWVIEAEENAIIVTPAKMRRSERIWHDFYAGPPVPIKVADGRIDHSFFSRWKLNDFDHCSSQTN